MDELDNEKPAASLFATAGAAAAAVAGLAMALNRRREQGTLAAGGLADLERLVEQVAELAPEMADALEPHAPGVAKTIRDRVPALTSASGKALSVAGVLASEQARSLGRTATSRAAALRERRRSVADAADAVVDSSSARFTEVQERAAQVAARAVDHASQFAEDRGLKDVREDVRFSAEEVAEMMRVVARDAAEQTADRLKQVELAAASGFARMRDEVSAFAASDSQVDHELIGGLDHPASTSSDASAVNEKRGGSGWLWFAAIAGLLAYLLYSPERRERTKAVAQDAATSAQEILRDFRGYDDEF